MAIRALRMFVDRQKKTITSKSIRLSWKKNPVINDIGSYKQEQHN